MKLFRKTILEKSNAKIVKHENIVGLKEIFKQFKNLKNKY